ncbi:MAG: hypothetical protein H0W89_06715 [Candidatus Levybacteria bacterium]|nr:hypothetical protein [Candidatus Levybacteria bacterium]
MQSLKSVLTKFNPTTDKYISREFQTFGLHLADQLDDYKHKSLYIKLAKTTPRAVLERALTFCVDSKATNKGALFMWKLKEIKKDSKSAAIALPTKTIVISTEAERSPATDVV